jgi:hypothetical protein
VQARVILAWSIVLGGILSSEARADVPGQRRGDPNMNVPGALRGTHYGSVTEGKAITPKVLFGKEGRPYGREIEQRKSSDCYADSTYSAYAQFHPQVIQRTFLNKDGTLITSKGGSPAARFYVKDQESREFKRSDPAIYSGRAPLGKDGKPVLNQVVDHKVWGSQIEVAYAKFRNTQGRSEDPERTGFNRMVGGYANHVMRALTGKNAKTITFTSSQADEVWGKLKAAQDKNQVVIAGTDTPVGLRGRAKEQVEHGMLDPDVMKRGQIDPKSGLKYDARQWAVGGAWIDGHDYAAWGDRDHPFLIERNGERFIRLRDPHGVNPPGGVGKDGVGVIPFNQFMLHWSQVDIGAGSAKDE